MKAREYPTGEQEPSFSVTWDCLGNRLLLTGSNRQELQPSRELGTQGVMALGTFPEFTGWWEAGKIQSQTNRDLLHDVVDSMAVFAGMGESGGPSGKSKNMSYQATEGPGCPGSRKKSCHLGLRAGTKESLMAKDPEQEGEDPAVQDQFSWGEWCFVWGLGQGLGAHRCLCISPESWDCP